MNTASQKLQLWRPAGLWRHFWRDDHGLILSAELIIIVTLVVIGLITGLVCMQQAVVTEFQDIAAAISGMNQSYWTPSFRGCRKIWGFTSWSSGSSFVDVRNQGFLSGSAVGTGTIPYTELGTGSNDGYGQIIENGPAIAPAPDTCLTCPPVETYSPPPAAPPADCVQCEANGSQTPLTPMPESNPEIPQGPVPQILPQQW